MKCAKTWQATAKTMRDIAGQKNNFLLGSTPLPFPLLSSPTLSLLPLHSPERTEHVPVTQLAHGGAEEGLRIHSIHRLNFQFVFLLFLIDCLFCGRGAAGSG